ncbi:hypothetical protein NMY22_g14551 [Coprinellus aureogranulatus]|nr:hypothetical protein NMY22_g14551 [Coprinellus aureogranulatus]
MSSFRLPFKMDPVASRISSPAIPCSTTSSNHIPHLALDLDLSSSQGKYLQRRSRTLEKAYIIHAELARDGMENGRETMYPDINPVILPAGDIQDTLDASFSHLSIHDVDNTLTLGFTGCSADVGATSNGEFESEPELWASPFPSAVERAENHPQIPARYTLLPSLDRRTHFDATMMFPSILPESGNFRPARGMDKDLDDLIVCLSSPALDFDSLPNFEDSMAQFSGLPDLSLLNDWELAQEETEDYFDLLPGDDFPLPGTEDLTHMYEDLLVCNEPLFPEFVATPSAVARMFVVLYDPELCFDPGFGLIRSK